MSIKMQWAVLIMQIGREVANKRRWAGPIMQSEGKSPNSQYLRLHSLLHKTAASPLPVFCSPDAPSPLPIWTSVDLGNPYSDLEQAMR